MRYNLILKSGSFFFLSFFFKVLQNFLWHPCFQLPAQSLKQTHRVQRLVGQTVPGFASRSQNISWSPACPCRLNALLGAVASSMLQMEHNALLILNPEPCWSPWNGRQYLISCLPMMALDPCGYGLISCQWTPRHNTIHCLVLLRENTCSAQDGHTRGRQKRNRSCRPKSCCPFSESPWWQVPWYG